MTKEKLRFELASERNLQDILRLTAGTHTPYYKAEKFQAEELIYIPNVWGNRISANSALRGRTWPEYMEDVMEVTFSGQDFLNACNGNREVARAFFAACAEDFPRQGRFASLRDRMVSN